MTTASASSQTGNFWSFDWSFDSPAPQPTQDADLLRTLNFVPGLKEILMLRQVHALEHATVWVLSDTCNSPNARGVSTSRQLDNNTLGGLSTDQGFYLYGQVNSADLHRAVRTALRRITRGEWNLAVHPRCGTNLSVGMLVTAGLALGIHLVLPRGPIEQLLGLGIATTAAAQLTPDLGGLAQQYITTSIPFNLAIEDISATPDIWGRPAHFVRLRWIEQ
ncbi:hypothetical protein H6F78_10840 [Coleofasciculus sp. FACHB-64]|uniref:DUF6391 domain-containing protein n=1 Tax=Cyanophyceae TaxID=3028117 RepID=UPI001689B262|nr:MULTISPECIES: DUF6391 domain-containing protein [unclassified Coleofasciculus]MBD1889287.1 hypothetical protein [Coleofasciculus sp. FACHB-SPT9]MBD1897612.1 hypothetical protein [Coleofasciculus sp. FACHB-129]MBD1899402.1 hypothetical protein [Coleofasciculus sp. FACHB-125]MBD2046085.1 hypothetical protein [Coleofasciculus sp. FACHB-64]MBD2540882.1 hypothetical protein [Coleofasciculus sp. FACHB-SPT36]